MSGLGTRKQAYDSTTQDERSGLHANEGRSFLSLDLSDQALWMGGLLLF